VSECFGGLRRRIQRQMPGTPSISAESPCLRRIVIAPALGGYIIHGYGFAMIFVVSAAVGIVALLLSCLLPRPQSVEFEDDDGEITLLQFFLIFKEPRLLPIYAVIVINMFMVGILFGFLPVYLYGIGYTPIQSGSVVSVATFSYLLVQPLAGHLADKVEIRTTVFAGLLLAASSIIAITFTSRVPLIGVVIIAGIGIGTVWTNSDTLVSTLATKGQLGASIGAAQSFKEFGDMVGPLLVGVITQLFGVRVGFVSCGVVALACLIFLARSIGKVRSRVPLRDRGSSLKNRTPLRNSS
jgi:MFS transporter, ACDE family, multidrug resistance protein